MFAGTFTALVTPFSDDRIDEAAFERLIESQIEGGITGIVPVGTTGESPTLDHAEHARVIELAVKFARKRCPVIAGTGSNSTAEADLAHAATPSGSALTPCSWSRRTTTSLRRKACSNIIGPIAKATRLPIIPYSIPARCGIEIGVETLARLVAECPTIVAIKEAGGAVERVSQLRAGAARKLRNPLRRRFADPALHGCRRRGRDQRGLQPHSAPGRRAW